MTRIIIARAASRMGVCASRARDDADERHLSRATSANSARSDAMARSETRMMMDAPARAFGRDVSLVPARSGVDGVAEARERVRVIESEVREARERARAERRAHAVMLAEERRARDVVARTAREERRRRVLGGDRGGEGAWEVVRGATHTCTHGAVLDRRYLAGLAEETADATRLPRIRRAESASPAMVDEAMDGLDFMDRASVGSMLAVSAAETARSETSVHGGREGAAPATPADGRHRSAGNDADDREVPTRTTPFSDRVEAKLQASALKGHRPEDATP